MKKSLMDFIVSAAALATDDVQGIPRARRKKARDQRTPEQQQRTIEAAQEKRERRAARRRKHARKHCPEEE